MRKRHLCICLVSPMPPPYGGIAHWTHMISRYAAKQTDGQLCVVNTAPRWRRIDDLRVCKRVIGGSLQALRDLMLFIATLLFRRPDVIHLTTSGQFAVLRDLGVMAIAKLAGVPVIYHIRFGRVPDIAQSDTREWRWIARAMRRSWCVIAIDAATASTINTLLPEVRCGRIPNCIVPVAAGRPAAPTKESRIALYLGWVIPTKGIEELIQAWAKLQPKGWRLRIVGPGDLRYQENLLHRYRPDNIEFIGELPHQEAMDALAAADVFILPSHTEGFPNVVLEAMLYEKPIIATRVGAIPEILSSDCGVLVEPRDVDSLADALRNVLGDAALRARLGKDARSKALREYQIDSVFEQLWNTWLDAAGRADGAIAAFDENATDVTCDETLVRNGSP